jgi:hypothetical protein
MKDGDIYLENGMIKFVRVKAFKLLQKIQTKYKSGLVGLSKKQFMVNLCSPEKWSWPFWKF